MNDTSDHILVESAERDWNEAIKSQNIARAKEFMHEDYVLVGVRSTGSSIVDRTQWLEGLAAMRIHSYEAAITRTRVYGDSAVVSVTGAWRIEFRGQEIDENFFLTDVWSKRTDGWKVVLRHSSPYSSRG